MEAATTENDDAAQEDEDLPDATFLESIEEAADEEVPESVLSLGEDASEAVEASALIAAFLQEIHAAPDVGSSSPSKLSSPENGTRASSPILTPSEHSLSKYGSSPSSPILAPSNSETGASSPVSFKRKADTILLSENGKLLRGAEKVTLQENETGGFSFVEEISRCLPSMLFTPPTQKRKKKRKKMDSVVDPWKVDATIPHNLETSIDSIISPL
jgi:hypothetical protein